MRSPITVQLALDSASTMVNCTIKSEEKKEPPHEAPQVTATAVEPQPGDPALAPQEVANSQAPAQVSSAFFRGTPLVIAPHPALCLHLVLICPFHQASMLLSSLCAEMISERTMGPPGEPR